MTQNFEEQLAGLFAQAERDLPDEHFRSQAMLKVTRQKRKSTILRYGYWVFVLLCLCSIFPVAVKFSLVLGEIIGNSPIMLKNFLQSYLDFPMMLIILSASACYLLIKFRLLKQSTLYFFGRINLFKLYK